MKVCFTKLELHVFLIGPKWASVRDIEHQKGTLKPMTKYWSNVKPKPKLFSYVPSFGQTLYVSGKYVLIFQLKGTLQP